MTIDNVRYQVWQQIFQSMKLLLRNDCLGKEYMWQCELTLHSQSPRPSPPLLLLCKDVYVLIPRNYDVRYMTTGIKMLTS